MINFNASATSPGDSSNWLWLVAAAALPSAAWAHALYQGSLWPIGGVALGLGSAIKAAMTPRATQPSPGRSARDELARLRAASAAAMGPLSAALGRLAAGSDRFVEAVVDCSARATSALSVARTSLQAGQRADIASRALSSALKEAEEEIFSTRKVVAEALRKTEETERLIVGMATRSGEIGEIVDAIEDLASQTHMAALNAAIESARAKPASPSLSPAAQEFKAASQQTARAALRLREQADAMKQAAHAAAEAVAALRFAVAEADELAESTFKTTRARCRASDDVVRDAYESAASARAVFAYVDAIDAGLKLAIAGYSDAPERVAEAKERVERLRALLDPALKP